MTFPVQQLIHYYENGESEHLAGVHDILGISLIINRSLIEAPIVASLDVLNAIHCRLCEITSLTLAFEFYKIFHMNIEVIKLP